MKGSKTFLRTWIWRGVFSFTCLTVPVAEVWGLDEFRPLYRGVRAQAMGNAFVAVADDEQTIFYNPAGLAGIKGISFNIASLNAQVSSDVLTNYSTITDVLASPTASQINTLIGKNFYVQATGTSGLVAPGFGIVGIYDYQAALRLQNTSLPQGVVAAQNTYGVQLAFGTRILRLKNRGELRFGAAGKILRRAGGYQNPSLTQILTLSYSTLSENLRSSGMGYGADLGFHFIYPIKKWKLQVGLVMTDAGDTTFAGGGEVQKSNLTAGVAMVYTGKEMTATFAYDYSRILDYADWRKKTHLGMELKFPLLSLFAGVSEFNLTFGASLNLALLKVIYSSYAEELGATLGQLTERRHMFHAQFKFDL